MKFVPHPDMPNVWICPDHIDYSFVVSYDHVSYAASWKDRHTNLPPAPKCMLGYAFNTFDAAVEACENKLQELTNGRTS